MLPNVQEFLNIVDTGLFNYASVYNMLTRCQKYIDSERCAFEATKEDNIEDFVLFVKGQAEQCIDNFKNLFRFREQLLKQLLILTSNRRRKSDPNKICKILQCKRSTLRYIKHCMCGIDTQCDVPEFKQNIRNLREAYEIKRRNCVDFGRTHLESDICEMYSPVDSAMFKRKSCMTMTIGQNPSHQNEINFQPPHCSQSSKRRRMGNNVQTFYIAPSVTLEVPKSLRQLMAPSMRTSNLSKLFKISCLFFKMFEMERKFCDLFEEMLKQKFNLLKGYMDQKMDNKFIDILGNQYSETNFESSENKFVQHMEALLMTDPNDIETISNAFLATNLDLSFPCKNGGRVFIPTGSGITNEKFLVYLVFLLGVLKLLIAESFGFKLNDEDYVKMLKIVHGNDPSPSPDPITSTTHCECFCHILKSSVKSNYVPSINQRMLDKQNALFDRKPQLVLTHGGRFGYLNKGHVICYATEIEAKTKDYSDVFMGQEMKKAIFGEATNNTTYSEEHRESEITKEEACAFHVNFLTSLRSPPDGGANDTLLEGDSFPQSWSKGERFVRHAIPLEPAPKSSSKSGSQAIGTKKKVFKFESMKYLRIRTRALKPEKIESMMNTLISIKSQKHLFSFIRSSLLLHSEPCTLIISDRHIPVLEVKNIQPSRGAY